MNEPNVPPHELATYLAMPLDQLIEAAYAHHEALRAYNEANGGGALSTSLAWAIRNGGPHRTDARP